MCYIAVIFRSKHIELFAKLAHVQHGDVWRVGDELQFLRYHGTIAIVEDPAPATEASSSAGK